MRSKLGLDYRTSSRAGRRSTVAPGVRPPLLVNAQTFPDHVIRTDQNVSVGLLTNEQVFPAATITHGAAPGGLQEGALLPVATAPINAGLVFCVGSAPSGSSLVAQEQISGAGPTLLASGTIGGTNASHGTWKCLDSTSLTNGGAHWPSTTQLRSITTQRTLAFHGDITSFGDWAAMISVPYRGDGTWALPWMSMALRRDSNTTRLNTMFARGANAYSSYRTDITGAFGTGEHWYAVTLDGAAGKGFFYRDGAQFGDPDGFTIETVPIDWSTQPVCILNKSNSHLGEGTIGKCYTAAIWNRVLTPAEILSLYQTPRMMFSTVPSGTLAITVPLLVNTQTFPTQTVRVDQNVSVGLLVNQQDFPTHQIFLAANIPVAVPLLANAQTFPTHALVVEGGAPVVDAIELPSTDPAVIQSTITADSVVRQSWWGYGWGAGSHFNGPRNFTAVRDNATALCEDLNAKVLRIHTPEQPDNVITAYKATWDVVSDHGFDTIFSSSYIYTTANNDAGPILTPRPQDAADGISECMTRGIDPATWAATLQNEPDAGRQWKDANGVNLPYLGNNPHQNGNYTDPVRTDQRTFHNRLNTHTNTVKVIRLGLEWRHPPDSGRIPSEYDTLLEEDDLLSPTNTDPTLDAGCLHIYNKGPNKACYDDRWRSKGTGLWSTESGDAHSPRAQAIFVNGVNNGTSVEIHHIGATGSGTDDARQFLIVGDVPQPWYGGVKVLSRALVRGTRMRHCISTDRPGSPLPNLQAEQMVWFSSGTVQRQPRQQVAVGKRADGRWVVLAVNYTFTVEGVATPSAGGHFPMVTQQLTVDIAELIALGTPAGDRLFKAERANTNGAITSGININCKAGRLRFTLQPGQTIAMTSTT